MPANASAGELTLEKALNRLKHRDAIALNFSFPSSGSDIFYLFTNSNMGQWDSISEIDVLRFCTACKSAAQYL